MPKVCAISTYRGMSMQQSMGGLGRDVPECGCDVSIWLSSGDWSEKRRRVAKGDGLMTARKVGHPDMMPAITRPQPKH